MFISPPEKVSPQGKTPRLNAWCGRQRQRGAFSLPVGVGRYIMNSAGSAWEDLISGHILAVLHFLLLLVLSQTNTSHSHESHHCHCSRMLWCTEPHILEPGRGGGETCRVHRGFAQHLFALPLLVDAREWWSKAAALNLNLHYREHRWLGLPRAVNVN